MRYLLAAVFLTPLLPAFAGKAPALSPHEQIAEMVTAVKRGEPALTRLFARKDITIDVKMLAALKVIGLSPTTKRWMEAEFFIFYRNDHQAFRLARRYLYYYGAKSAVALVQKQTDRAKRESMG